MQSSEVKCLETDAEVAPQAGVMAGVARAMTRGLTRAMANISKASIAGTASGMVEMVAMFPLETVKTRLQVGGHGHGGHGAPAPPPPAAATGAEAAAKAAAAAHQHKGIAAHFREIFQKEGVRGFFSGVTVPVMGASAMNAVLFGVYEHLTLMGTVKSKGDPPVYVWFGAGMAAGFASAFITTPIDVVTLRMQLLGAHGGGAKISPIGMAKQVVQQHGPLGMYRGLIPTLLRETPGYGLFFTIYEVLKRQLNSWMGTAPQAPADHHSGGEHGGSFISVVLAGGTAGSVSQMIVFPFDIIKARVQTSSTPMTTRSCLNQLLKAEGPRGLYRGVGAAAIHGFPAAALGFSAYELTIKLLGDK